MIVPVHHNPAEIAAQFAVEARFVDAEPYGSGHINDTYLSRWDRHGQCVRRIIQRINHHVFKVPEQLMENIERVTRHVRLKLEATAGANPDRECLSILRTVEGALVHRDDRGDYWRMYPFIGGTRTHDLCTSPHLAYEAAKAFGRFQRHLADLPGERLHDTIPFFHHTPRRLQHLEQAIREDRQGRLAQAREAVDFAFARTAFTSLVTDRLASGVLPERITHNDTKLNNVLMDEQTERAVCVIDLDTVMNGSVLYDFGDMVRTCGRAAAEDERDLGRVQFNLDAFEALVRGYLEGAAGFLTPAEVELLVEAGRLITLTIGIRFLTDYLSGDVYFKTHRPGQNLDRARVHFKLVAEMEALGGRMQDIVDQAASWTPSHRKAHEYAHHSL
jgi:Ser/Thr protein kinase RdoA (MazF antagonist)